MIDGCYLHINNSISVMLSLIQQTSCGVTSEIFTGLSDITGQLVSTRKCLLVCCSKTAQAAIVI